MGAIEDAVINEEVTEAGRRLKLTPDVIKGYDAKLIISTGPDPLNKLRSCIISSFRHRCMTRICQNLSDVVVVSVLPKNPIR